MIDAKELEWINVLSELPPATDIYIAKDDKGRTFKCWFLVDCFGGKVWGSSAKGRNVIEWAYIPDRIY